MTLGFIMAYFYKAAWWKRAVVFLSSVPVTILMNSLRIGIIGVMVDRWGKSMAEGFLHDFEGWLIFMASASVLLLEIVMLSRIGSDSRPWREIFGVELPAVTPSSALRVCWQPPSPFVASSILVGLLAASSLFLPERVEKIPQRNSFAEFPSQLGNWSGKRSVMKAEYMDVLQLDDYILADYRGMSDQLVSLYIAWYNSQRAGQSSHSPRTCLPGGGWQMTTLEQVVVPDARVGSIPLRVNRAIIENGRDRQLVYYWFQQRGRVVTNEYLVKWYLFWDSLTRQRTDGALVRLIVTVQDGKSIEQAEAEMQSFTRLLLARIEAYVPG
jgi:exosortase D (VPLPA-CTERM-specific)